MTDTPSVPHCSFCGKPESQVKQLIMQDDVCICDECIAACNDVIVSLSLIHI